MTEDDSKLFRDAVGDARPIKSEERVDEVKRRPKPKARFSRADEADALRESLEAEIDDSEAGSGEMLRFHRPSVGKRTMRQLTRGKFAVQDEIDLHGMTLNEARPRLADFIDYAARTGKRCVRVVHGKGRGSGERGPVLKPAVARWLRKTNVVLAYVSTRQVDGGTGAVYVLLDEP